MNNTITAFFAAFASNFIAADGNAAIGVLSYAMSFVFVPEGFLDGDFATIAESAAVDAGVSVEEMAEWLDANADKIAAAIQIVGDVHGPREPTKTERFLTHRVLNHGVTWEQAEQAMYDAYERMRTSR